MGEAITASLMHWQEVQSLPQKKGSENMTNKESNREKLQQIADNIGDLYLMEMFWSMFDDLSESKQKTYITWAKRIENENRK